MAQLELHPGLLCAALIPALFLTGCTGGGSSDEGFQAQGIRVTEAWIRAGPPAATVFAGYAILENVGNSPVVVTGARSTRFRAVSLHKTVIEGDIARMLEVRTISIAPRAKVELEPGGQHLMMFEPTRPVVEDERIEIFLNFADGGESSFHATVRRHGGN